MTNLENILKRRKIGHPKIKLFISQGSLQSTEEAIAAGVPLIGIPMLGDQWFNVEKYEKHGIGVHLDLDAMTEEALESAVNNVIDDGSYRKNIVRLRSLVRDSPMSGLERAVWWTEHVLRHGGAAHLRSPAANISWTQYIELELVLVVLCCVLSAAIFILFMLYFAFMFTLGYAEGKAKND